MKPLPRPEDLEAGRVEEIARTCHGSRVLLVLRDGDETMLVIATVSPDGKVDRFGSSFRGSLDEIAATIARARARVA